MPYSSAYGSYRGFDISGTVPRRNSLSISDKLLVINGGSNVLTFSYPILKSKYNKK